MKVGQLKANGLLEFLFLFFFLSTIGHSFRERRAGLLEVVAAAALLPPPRRPLAASPPHRRLRCLRRPIAASPPSHRHFLPSSFSSIPSAKLEIVLRSKRDSVLLPRTFLSRLSLQYQNVQWRQMYAVLGYWSVDT